MTHGGRIRAMVLAAGLPGALTALVLLWSGDVSDKVRWTLAVLIAGAWWGFAGAVATRVTRPLQTLSNMHAALREGDFSLRLRGARRDDALGEAMSEVNALGETLRAERLAALEATALLRRVMAEIDVAIFAFDGERRLRLVNRGGERLLGRPAERVLGLEAGALELGDYLEDETPRVVERAFPGVPGTGRWEVRGSTFWQGGRPHRLLVVSDLRRVLREEEAQAWQRLVRVLSHEINNSLAPIRSMAGSLETLAARPQKPEDWEEDLRRGLAVIAGRSEALGRFMAAYSRLARLPRPRLAPLDVAAWVRRVAGLETRLAVAVAPGPQLVIAADGDQLDQLLINLVRNAADAALETGGGVSVSWRRVGAELEVAVEDEGPGLPEDAANLFVPFFTTKPQGSGIGLALSRQIAEAHGGTLVLENRREIRGCVARLRLPLERST